MKFDPSAKLFFTLLIATCAFLFPWYGNASLLLLLLILRCTVDSYQPESSHPHLSLTKLLSSLAALTLLMVTINGLLLKQGNPVFGIWGISLFSDGIAFGLQTSFRLVVLITALYLFFSSTTVRSFIELLFHLGFPKPVLLLVLLTLHWIESLQARIRQIFIAQEARGAAVRGSFLRRVRTILILLSPLLLASIAESLDRGIALELRGFSLRDQQPAQQTSFLQSLSAAALFFMIVTMLVIFFWTVQWLMQ